MKWKNTFIQVKVYIGFIKITYLFHENNEMVHPVVQVIAHPFFSPLQFFHRLILAKLVNLCCLFGRSQQSTVAMLCYEREGNLRFLEVSPSDWSLTLVEGNLLFTDNFLVSLFVLLSFYLPLLYVCSLVFNDAVLW